MEGRGVLAYKSRTPREDEEQSALFEWARMQSGKYPELELLHHIPNGGSRNKAEAAKLKRQGVKAGVPDICLPIARGGSHGLYIELKRQRGGKVSPEQLNWLLALTEQGYTAVICTGWEAAAKMIIDYLKERIGKDETIEQGDHARGNDASARGTGPK